MGAHYQAVVKHALLALTIGPVGLLASSPATAATKTWVASTGVDSNACTRAAPCKTFASAIGKTDAGGEIDCVDPADFGAVTITKSITISCNNIGNGGISVSSGDAVDINAGATDVIVLDGLVLSGSTGAVSGIYFKLGGALIVRNTTFTGLFYGLYCDVNNDATLNIDNSSFTKGNKGVYISPNNAVSVRANISRSQFSNNDTALYAEGNFTTGAIFVSVRGTSISNSNGYGIHTSAGKATYSTVALDEVTVSGSSSYGLYAEGAKAGMLVNNTTITSNQGGGVYPYNGGVIYSYGNNRVNGNNMKDGTFTATLAQR